MKELKDVFKLIIEIISVFVDCIEFVRIIGGMAIGVSLNRCIHYFRSFTFQRKRLASVIFLRKYENFIYPFSKVTLLLSSFLLIILVPILGYGQYLCGSELNMVLLQGALIITLSLLFRREALLIPKTIIKIEI